MLLGQGSPLEIINLFMKYAVREEFSCRRIHVFLFFRYYPVRVNVRGK